MKLIIDIPENVYKNLERVFLNGQRNGKTLLCDLISSVWKGTPLPKGHGRLIDAYELRKKWIFGKSEKEEIDAAPTIIEADKESEVEE